MRVSHVVTVIISKARYSNTRYKNSMMSMRPTPVRTSIDLPEAQSSVQSCVLHHEIKEIFLSSILATLFSLFSIISQVCTFVFIKNEALKRLQSPIHKDLPVIWDDDRLEISLCH